MHSVHTIAAPPNHGRTCLARMGWTRKRRKALRKTVAACSSMARSILARADADAPRTTLARGRARRLRRPRHRGPPAVRLRAYRNRPGRDRRGARRAFPRRLPHEPARAPEPFAARAGAAAGPRAHALAPRGGIPRAP